MKRILSTCGLDEAGRGPVFGPLVVAALVCPTTALPELVELGVRDSKALAPARRERVYEALVARSDVQYQTVHISSEDIDLRRTRGESLNEIELVRDDRSLTNPCHADWRAHCRRPLRG